MLVFLVFLGIILLPYLIKNKNLKDSTRTTCIVAYLIVFVLYLIFGVWL